MGRTVPTFTNIIDSEIAGWSKFRRGLQLDHYRHDSLPVTPEAADSAEGKAALALFPIVAAGMAAAPWGPKRRATCSMSLSRLRRASTSAAARPRVRERDAARFRQLAHLRQRLAGKAHRQRADRMHVRTVQRPRAVPEHFDEARWN